MCRKLISRSIKKFYRDKGSLLFFLLSVSIVISFNMLFLNKLQLQSIQAVLGEGADGKEILALINIWCMAGLIPVASLTSTIGVLSVLPTDRENKKTMDFSCTPVGFMVYPVSVVISSIFISIIMGLIVFTCYGTYIFFSFGNLFTVMQILETMAMVALSAFMGASIMGFVVSFFSSIMVFATVGIVLEVIICILSGVYVPVGVFPDFIQKMISVSPFGNLAALFRQVLIEGSITKVFKGVPEESIDQYRLFYGIDIVMKDIRMDRLLSVKFILGFSSVCLLLFFINYSIKSKKI